MDRDDSQTVTPSTETAPPAEDAPREKVRRKVTLTLTTEDDYAPVGTDVSLDLKYEFDPPLPPQEELPKNGSMTLMIAHTFLKSVQG
jgi:hypothetical protein